MNFVTIFVMKYKYSVRNELVFQLEWNLPINVMSFRWWRWQGATSPISFVSPASSRQTRGRTNVVLSTSAALWHSTTGSGPTSRWRPNEARVTGRWTPRLGSTGTRDKGARYTPTKQRLGNWRGDLPMTATLTALRAVFFRELWVLQHSFAGEMKSACSR